MKRFQLRYELPRGDAFIAPQLLSSDQPTYELEEQGSLVLRYRYEFMPKGMITRLIVTLHHLIADPRLVWKSGVVLERQETRAEVIEDYPHRTIRVWVAGRDPRGLLAIVDDQLGLMHHSFPRLKFDKYLPCNCPKCRVAAEPYMFPLETLRDFARTGDRIQCHRSRDLVDAATLIRDVLPSAIGTPSRPGYGTEVAESDPRESVIGRGSVTHISSPIGC